jgi:ribonucleoside-diphosphate reductase alpha chain
MKLSNFGLEILADRYAYYDGETWQQVAHRVANGVHRDNSVEADLLEEAIALGYVIPAGRILRSVNGGDLTGYNCYVLPPLHDSRGGIIHTLSEMIEIMSHGGGVGIDLSSLRPRHAKVRGVDGKSSGAVSWGSIYAAATGLIEQGGSRRGALMLTIADWHPDVLEFITAKKRAGYMENCNMSIKVSYQFLRAVQKDEDWDLVFPDTSTDIYDFHWDGDIRYYDGPIVKYQTVKARMLWEMITESAWESAEPGVLFWDNIEVDFSGQQHSSPVTVNPCGEQPLPAYGVCNLGHVNLAQMYDPDTDDVNWNLLEYAIRRTVRMLDKLIDSTNAVLSEVEENQKNGFPEI